MQIRRVRNEESSWERFVEELWLPYLRELGRETGSWAVPEDVDVDDIVDYRTDYFDAPEKRVWVALDDVDDSSGPLDELDATLAGFVGSTLRTPPAKFETTDTVHIGNFYVEPEYRGTGLADDLVARVCQHAREDGAVELSLEVDADNDRALAYYEKLGFEVAEYEMRVPLDAVAVDDDR
jgi:ribosomal protein S18 acetylase RimI-like enzyme